MRTVSAPNIGVFDAFHIRHREQFRLIGQVDAPKYILDDAGINVGVQAIDAGVVHEHSHACSGNGNSAIFPGHLCIATYPVNTR